MCIIADIQQRHRNNWKCIWRCHPTLLLKGMETACFPCVFSIITVPINIISTSPDFVTSAEHQVLYLWGSFYCLLCYPTGTFCDLPIRISQCQACFHIIRYSCAVFWVVSATQLAQMQGHACLTRTEWKKKENSSFNLGSEEPQACCLVADKPAVPAQSACPGGFLQRATGLGSSWQVEPG